jgi:pilus assembly protein FimV
MNPRSHLHGIGLTLLLSSVLASGAAQAMGIGKARVESFLGEPLRVRVDLAFAPGETITGACVRIASPPGRESPFIPDLARARFQLVEGPSGAQLLITTRKPYTDPILVFPLKVGCGAGGIYREITLLIDPPSMAAPARAARAEPAPPPTPVTPRPVTPSRPAKPAYTPPPASALSREPGGQWRVERGQTLSGIIASTGLDGGDRRRRRDLIDAVVAANPDVFKRGPDYMPAGALITLPGWQQAAAEEEAAEQKPPEVAEPARPETAEPAPKQEEDYRLELSGEQPSGTVVTPEMKRIEDELQRLNAASEQERKANAELQDRLLELKQRAAELQLVAERLAQEGRLAMGEQQPAGAPSEPPSPSSQPGEDVAPAPAKPLPESVVSVKPPEVLRAPPPPVQPPPKEEPLVQTLMDNVLPIALLIFIGLVSAAFMIRRGRRDAGDSTPTLDQLMAQRELDQRVGAPEDGELPEIRAVESDEFDEELQPEPDSRHYIFSVEEVDSLLEQAEVLLLFGEPHKAIEMIGDYLDGPGRQSKEPRPWLKLFQLLRAEERREDFEKRAEAFKRSFNIEKPNWKTYQPDGMRVSGVGLEEGCPHILQRIEGLWGEPVQVIDYLEALLLDDRDGARSGFPHVIAEDLLVLRDVARDRHNAA